MAIEIERKFLVLGTPWATLPQGALMRQGYLHATPEKVVRVRIEGDAAMLTIKAAAKGLAGISRGEWEYPIPVADAEDLLLLCNQPLIEKYRYRLPFEGMEWELDVFLGDNAGLVVAEIELDSEDQIFSRPEWLGQEVSDDKRYLNANLMCLPFARW